MFPSPFLLKIKLMSTGVAQALLYHYYLSDNNASLIVNYFTVTLRVLTLGRGCNRLTTLFLFALEVYQKKPEGKFDESGRKGGDSDWGG